MNRKADGGNKEEGELFELGGKRMIRTSRRFDEKRSCGIEESGRGGGRICLLITSHRPLPVTAHYQSPPTSSSIYIAHLLAGFLFFSDFLTFEDGSYTLSRNVGKRLHLDAAYYT